MKDKAEVTIVPKDYPSGHQIRLVDAYPSFDLDAPVPTEVIQFSMMEFGQAVAVSNYPEAVHMAEQKLKRQAEKLIDGLEENTKHLWRTEIEYKEAPMVDKFTRFRQIGYHLRVGSPQIDFFNALFKGCKRTHVPVREAMTWKWVVSLVLVMLGETVTRVNLWFQYRVIGRFSARKRQEIEDIYDSRSWARASQEWR